MLRVLSSRLRASARLRLAAMGAAGLLVFATGAIAAASLAPTPGPFTGCLSTRLGLVYNVRESATTPLASCARGDTLVSFSNAKGLQGAPGPAGATGPAGHAGAPGLDGAGGPAGKDGLDGAAGLDGKDGLDGAAGATGATGASGATGATGATGPIQALYIQNVNAPDVSIDPSGIAAITVLCPTVTGRTLIGATGGEHSLGGTEQLLTSDALSGGNGWEFVVRNLDSVPRSFFGEVRCLYVSP